ncbi:hypothetical protein [Roseomonas fluvialis]|uniref:Transposase n=1 Tax=Roseomonas fluvialis TaxID=1750527 RepID=A0ABM7XZZ5_9PROT|nr:hypothetical protein [Roseomonas fluvialis]BDG71048.1 hypothetical protein Rmf_09770 [Roseomonas fluvialis]
MSDLTYRWRFGLKIHLVAMLRASAADDAAAVRAAFAERGEGYRELDA